MVRALPLLALLSFGCDRAPPARPDLPDAPPNGRGRVTDADGQDHTLFRPLGVIRYGDERSGTVPDPRVLLGYEFEARAGARPVIALSGPKGRRSGLALYGPRGSDGLWDNPIAFENGDGTLSLDGISLDLPGMYFILVRALDLEGLDYTLRLRCEGEACGEPLCPEIEACDLVCPAGYGVDASDCRRCACEAAACEPGGCPEGQRCVGGSCRDLSCAEACPPGQDPVCGDDGQTWRTACTAECAGVGIAHLGPCRAMSECAPERPCPEGAECRDGRCVRDDCGCPALRAPVCSAEGETYANRCALDCRGAEFGYPGPCVAGYCRDVGDCAEGERCEPRPDPDNRRRCAAAPDSVECVRQCRSSTCGHDGPMCTESEICAAPDPDQPGTCLTVCRLGGGCPQRDEICASFPRIPRGLGVCLTSCADHPCPEGLACGSDQVGHRVCVASGCGCPPAAPEDVVCADGRELPSACEARCAGAREIHPGPCGEEPGACDCPARQVPMICGEDGVVYADGCDARCADQRAGRPVACFGDVALRCGVDADCLATGCEGTVCAAAPTRACPEQSAAATCRVELGTCGCVEGQCSFRLTREAFACIEAAHAAP